MLGRLRTALRERGTREVYSECRHCGLSVETDTDTCSYCGTESIVRYDLR